ncbi:MAG: ABC transporter ATP-binding protein [Streptococcaceae bacterium]|nr:ABC transporter ATP-binding protein [Streptococcaceae bacterium]
MIKIENISKTIKHQQILNNISLSFEKGKIYGLKGRNGSGKTMLFRAISGLIHLDEGKISINGKIVRKDIDFPPSLGLLLENDNLIPHLSGVENLLLLAKIKKIATKEDVIQAIKRVGLDPENKTPVKKYSLGMRQRLSIAQAIFEKPDIILLDEPTNGIDIESIGGIRKLILEENQRGALVIVTSHNEEDLLELAEEIITIDSGRVVSNA